MLWGHRPVTDIYACRLLSSQAQAPACSSLPVCILWCSESRSESEVKPCSRRSRRTHRGWNHYGWGRYYVIIQHHKTNRELTFWITAEKYFWASQSLKNDSFHYHNLSHSVQQHLESHTINLFYPPSSYPGAKPEVSRLSWWSRYFHSKEVEIFWLQNTTEQLW